MHKQEAKRLKEKKNINPYRRIYTQISIFTPLVDPKSKPNGQSPSNQIPFSYSVCKKNQNKRPIRILTFRSSIVQKSLTFIFYFLHNNNNNNNNNNNDKRSLLTSVSDSNTPRLYLDPSETLNESKTKPKTLNSQTFDCRS